MHIVSRTPDVALFANATVVQIERSDRPRIRFCRIDNFEPGVHKAAAQKPRA